MCFARVAAVLVLTAVAFAGDPETQLDATQKATYQRICQSLVAPCCWRESVAQHRSPESLKSRDEIAAMIVAGKSEREIRNDFVARYGRRVLIEPEGGRSRWLYLLPLLALGAAVAAAVRFLVSRVPGAPTAQPSADAVDDSEWEW